MLEKLVQLIKDERSSPVLNDGANQADIERLEKLQSVELSSSLIELYTEADGENFTEDDWSSDASTLLYEYKFISIREVIVAYEYNLSLYEEFYSFDPDGYQSVPRGVIKAHVFNPHWIPFASCDNSMYLVVDHSPGEKGVQNQIVACGRDLAPNVYLVARSLEEALDMIYESKKRDASKPIPGSFDGFTNELQLSYPESLRQC